MVWLHDLKACLGQCLNDAFGNLFRFFRIHDAIWMIFAAIANRRGNYRVHLVRISQGAPPFGPA
jgi:hypothetical protein